MRSSVLLATFLLTIAALAAERWTSPDHFYSIAPPAGWGYREDTARLHRRFGFISPDRKAEFAFSAIYNLVRLPRDLPDSALEYLIPGGARCQVDTESARGRWDGLRRGYTNADQSARWLAVVARRGSTLVGTTMRAEASELCGLPPDL
jgi:hypothetical protein